MADELDPAAQGVVDHLHRLKVDFELMACDPALADTTEFCAAYGIAPEDSANTILVVGKSEPPVVVACVVLATTRLDVNHVVRRRLNVKKCSFASADQTVGYTGMMIGGVTAFGLPVSIPVWVDAAVMARERIVLGGGSRSWKIRCAPDALTRLENLEVIDGLAGGTTATSA